MKREERAGVMSVAIDLENRVQQLESDLSNETNPQRRLELRQEIHDFAEMVEKLENALK